MTTDERIDTIIKQINLTNQAFKIIDDMNIVSHNCLGVCKQIINNLSHDECIEVLAICDNIPISIKRELVIRAKRNKI